MPTSDPPPRPPSSLRLDTEVEWELERALRRGQIPPHDPVHVDNRVRLAPPPTTAATELWAELVEEDRRDRSWDHEFSPSPHSPASIRAKIAALGAVAIPELVHQLWNPNREARIQALATLGDMGAKAKPALADIARCAGGDDDILLAYAVAAFCSIDLQAVRSHGLCVTHRSCKAVVKWIAGHVGKPKRRKVAAVLLEEPLTATEAETILGVFREYPLIAPIERVVALSKSLDPAMAEPAVTARILLNEAREAALKVKK